MRVWALLAATLAFAWHCGADDARPGQPVLPPPATRSAATAATAAADSATDAPSASPTERAYRAMLGGEGLVPAPGTWGKASDANFNPLGTPRLPDYAGWQRFLLSSVYVFGFTVGDDLIVYQANEQLTALERSAGETRWSIDCRLLGDAGILLNKRWLVIGGGHGLVVYSAVSGEQSFELPERYPLALTGDMLWVSKVRYWSDPDVYYDLLGVSLIDLNTGETVQEFDTGRLTGVGSNKADPALGLPVRNDNGILLLAPDGSSRRFPSNHPRFATDITLTADGLVSVEYYSSTQAPETEEEYAKHWSGTLDDIAAHGIDAGKLGAELRLLDIDSGRQRWSRQFNSDSYMPQYSSKCANGYLALYDQLSSADFNTHLGRLRVFNIADGSPALDTEDVLTDPLRFIQYEVGPDAVYLVEDYQPGYYFSRLCSIAYEDREVSTFPQIERSQIDACAVRDGRLYLDFVTYGPADEPIGSSQSQALAIALDEHGLPISGAPARLDFPRQDLSLVEQFLSSDDPRADDALMRKLVEGGADPFNELVKRVPELTTKQLDALMAMGAYHHINSDNYMLLATPVIERLYQVADPKYSPQILRWLQDDSLAWYHDKLTGLLAACGGRAAMDYTNQAYENRQLTRREPLKPPYHFSEPTIDSPLVTWCEATDSSGARYRAWVTSFIYPSLSSDRDIYLAVDADGDGGYEEVLHTGLQDHYVDYLLPTGQEGLDKPIGPLKLEVDGDEVKITHHTPEYKTVTYGAGADAETYQQLAGATYGTTTLSLAELRRDSDGDGLTDIIEGQLLSDPHDTDTDGDGIEDFYDPQPNVDPATMGRLERGIARALSYARQQGQYDFNRGYESPEHPWSALYLEIDGAGDVAYSDQPYSFGVSAATPEAKRRLEQLGAISVNITAVDLSAADPDAKVERWDFRSPDYFNQNPDTPDGCEYVILFDQVGAGEAVYLVDHDGELYPVKQQGT